MSWLLLLGCPQPSTTSVVDADYDVFVEQVQPVLEPRCSTPACHGNASRPLELYAVGWHRADPDDDFLEGQLDEDELVANFDRVSAFLARPAADSLLLTKPLAEDAGGTPHVVTIYEDTGEPEYEALLDWASGGDE